MNIVIVEADGFIRQKLSEVLERAGVLDLCRIASSGEGVSPEDKRIELEGLTRVGALITRILALEGHEGAPIIDMGVFKLDAAQNLLLRADENSVRLTEKEVLLLQILHEACGRAVPREALLDKVWGYVEGVETHTLETHIYRLRQKIEVDPTAPEIIVTDEAGGYFLNV